MNAPTTRLAEKDESISINEIGSFSLDVEKYAKRHRATILEPHPRKSPPVFKVSEVAELCGLTSAQVQYYATREESHLPSGTSGGTKRARTFTLAETRLWVQQASSVFQTPVATGKPGNGKIIVTAQLKGGSTKTTSTMCFGQALTLRGRKVLLVDLDPQASLTELCGLFAEKDIQVEDTVSEVFDRPGENPNVLAEKIRETYWDGIDVIPAHVTLVSADAAIAASILGAASAKVEFRFWTLLREALEPLRAFYDYIIVDTAPSLSFLNINALMAADSIVMPVVPENLDFASSMAFWKIFANTADTFRRYEGEKRYDFIKVLLSKVDTGRESVAPAVRAWAQDVYGSKLSHIEIPVSSVPKTGALAYATVFDEVAKMSSPKSVQRVRQPIMDFCDWMDEKYVKMWRAGE